MQECKELLKEFEEYYARSAKNKPREESKSEFEKNKSNEAHDNKIVLQKSKEKKGLLEIKNCKRTRDSNLDKDIEIPK